MQSCASAAKLRGGGSILHNGLKAMVFTSAGSLAKLIAMREYKGAKGDVRSTALYLNTLRQMGLLGEEDAPEIETARGDQGMTGLPPVPVQKSHPGDGLFEHLDPSLLSKDEYIELSHLAEVIDLAGGDLLALSTADFERVKHIVNKGRGKGITAH